MHISKEPQFIISDLGQAVYHFTIYPDSLVDTSLQQDGRRLCFHFKRKPDSEKLVSAYLNGTGQAPAKALFENYRALRALTFTRTGNTR